MTKDELLDKLDAAESDEEIKSIAHELLELDPDSPYGKLALWEVMPYEEGAENLYLLKEALESMRAVIDAKEIPAFTERDRDAAVYMTILMNLGYTLLSEGNINEAYEAAKEFASFDEEGVYPSRTLLYRSMIDLELYDDILTYLETDSVESVAGEHARAIALLEKGASDEEVRDAVNCAFSLSPYVALFITEIWDMPDADEELDDDIEEAVNDAAYLADPWCRTDKRLAAISSPAFLFAYLTDNLSDEKEKEALREAYEGAGIGERVEQVRKRIEKMEKNGCGIEDTEAEALSAAVDILEELGKE
ncbi:MAG: hypothetical protein IKT09_07945 [Synergistes sp.]|nr:hypothetical protein [Synergistes sp.]